jgi:glycosyltransferase involved in cell wall biosynthesis
MSACATAAPVCAIIGVYPEEGWHSMDLCAEMLLAHWPGSDSKLTAERLRPNFHRPAGRVPWLGRKHLALNADRMVNRWGSYPLFLRRHLTEYAAFHVCDHSYAHLVHALPHQRTGVYCHDLDAFRCLLDTTGHPRPRWFRAMMGRVLSGLQQAAVVFYSTHEVRRQIEHYNLLDPQRLVHAPYGIAPEFVPASADEEVSKEIVTPVYRHPFLLHVGSCIPRKRIDILLAVFAAVRAEIPELQLVQLGGQWTPAQCKQMDSLGITQAVTQRQGLTRRSIAEHYRRAELVLLTSEAEGFGLPVIEALACGSPVVASDLPVLREVGAEAVIYCPVADAPGWIGTVLQLLQGKKQAPDRMSRKAQAQRYSWSNHAQTIAASYQRLLSSNRLIAPMQ